MSLTRAISKDKCSKLKLINLVTVLRISNQHSLVYLMTWCFLRPTWELVKLYVLFFIYKTNQLVKHEEN